MGYKVFLANDILRTHKANNLTKNKVQQGHQGL